MSVLQYVGVSLATILLILFICIRIFYYQQFQYWKKKGAPFMTPSFPFGNMGGSFVTASLSDVVRDIYSKMKHHKITGVWMLFKPVLYVNDLDLIKTILIKDFSSFHDRGFYHDPEGDPLSSHLVFINGIDWRNMRVKLTPTFTSGKMKMMFPLIVDTGLELVEVLKPQALGRKEIEVKNMLTCYTTDSIMSCAFGIKSNSIQNPNCIFKKVGRKLVELDFLGGIKFNLLFLAPAVAAYFKIRQVPKKVEEFFFHTVKQTIEMREKTGEKRNDFMQLLIQLKNKGRIDDVDVYRNADNEDDSKISSTKISLTEVTAQAVVFFLGGVETASTTVQFALYELSINPEIQKELRKELDEQYAKFGGWTYESILEMPYLNGVISETLRKYSPGAFLSRVCTIKYKVPGTDVELEPGDLVHIPTHGIHYDEQFFPNPEKFDPLRFTPAEVKKRHPCAYMPFGEGPRNCIGNRFGLMQSKIALALLIHQYQFEVTKKTPIPMKLMAKSMVIAPVGGMHLRITPRN